MTDENILRENISQQMQTIFSKMEELIADAVDRGEVTKENASVFSQWFENMEYLFTQEGDYIKNMQALIEVQQAEIEAYRSLMEKIPQLRNYL